MNEPPRIDPIKTIYRRTRCSSCECETWHRWSAGHRWTCECEHVRVEDIWNHHEQQEPLTDAPVEQLTLL